LERLKLGKAAAVKAIPIELSEREQSIVDGLTDSEKHSTKGVMRSEKPRQSRKREYE
jgi:hypothetical protein